MGKARKTNDQVVEELAAAVVARIEAGAGRWQRPWDVLAVAGMPVNATTGRPYSGVNVLILGLDERAVATGDPRWCTYRQAQGQGWQVRKGESGTAVLLVKTVRMHRPEDPAADDNGDVQVRMFRTFTVFHASQMDGIPAYSPTVRTAPERHAAADDVLDAGGAEIIHAGSRAYYTPARDLITLPPREAFTTTDGYYATALHELAHWTGGGTPTRVPRTVEISTRFGSEGYAREEVRAELAAAIILARLGITDPREATDCAGYIASWIRVLRDEPREVIAAMRDAQAIADHLHPVPTTAAIPEAVAA